MCPAYPNIRILEFLIKNIAQTATVSGTATTSGLLCIAVVPLKILSFEEPD